MPNFVRYSKTLAIRMMKRIHTNNDVSISISKKKSRDVIIGWGSLYRDAKTLRDVLNVNRSFGYAVLFEERVDRRCDYFSLGVSHRWFLRLLRAR
jgi:hypothetical protein